MLTRAGLRAFSTESLKVVNNVAKQQFTVAMRGEEAVIEYEISGKNITLNTTLVPKAFQGNGVGKLLAQHAFSHALDNKLDVICKCHFLAKYYEDNVTKFKALKIKMQLD